MKFLLTLYSALLFTFLCNAQNDSNKTNSTSEIVFFKDSNLKNLIKEIINKNQSEETKHYDWYLDFKENNLILISQYTIENLIAAQKRKNIQTTFIDDKILFIISEIDIDSFYDKSGYAVDLTLFFDKSDYSTTDNPYWLLKKNNKNKYKIIKEKKYKPN